MCIRDSFGTFEDVYAEESAFFTVEELELLHRPAPGKTENEFDFREGSSLND